MFRYLLGIKYKGLEFQEESVNIVDIISKSSVLRNTPVPSSGTTIGGEEDNFFTYGIMRIINGTPVIWRAKKWSRLLLLSIIHSER